MEENNKAFNTVLNEITTIAANDENIFTQYEEKSVIAQKIFVELNDRFDKDRKGFIMDGNADELNYKSIGILSQCQSLQSLVSLALDYGLDFDEKNIIPNQKGSIREIMDWVIDDIISRIVIKDKEGRVIGFVFDASPYDTTQFTEEYSNIDAITWVLPTFFTVLKYHATISEVCKWEKQLISVIKCGLTYIKEAFIDNEVENGPWLTGWNFTKGCKEPSLYYSFTVSECYLDMYETFKVSLEQAYEAKNTKEYGPSIDSKNNKADKEEKNKDKKTSENFRKEITRIYKLINDIDVFEEIRIENTVYGALEQNCRKVAKKVWGHVKENLADCFYYNDLNTVLTEKDIMNSTTNDALFNTVYMINIMIGGGIDEQCNLNKRRALNMGNIQEANEYQREHDNFFESCQLATQKAFRTYEKLKNKSKEYIVDQFLIGFNEEFEEEHKVMVSELRKLRMKAFSLLPMLIHTNNVLSEYLIKYPQHNMKKYLEYILENRYQDNDTVHWIWEKDGYFSGSNCYYIVALNEFYRYYETYESGYIKIGLENSANKKRIIKEYDKELNAPGGTIAELSEIIKEKEEQVAKLEKKLEEYHTPVEDAVKEIIAQELENKFASLMVRTFENASKALSYTKVDETTDDENGTYSKLYEAIYSMIIAKFYADYYSSPLVSLKSINEYIKETNSFKAKLKSNITSLITESRNKADKN